jgi:hypothetical protein
MIAGLRPTPPEAEPLLRRLLSSGSMSMRLHAAVTLNELRPGHPLAVPAILSLDGRVDDERLIHVLEQMGPSARRAAPWLLRRLRGEHHALAARALWAVSPDTARRAGLW